MNTDRASYVDSDMPHPEPASSTAEICAAHDQSISKAKEVATQLGDAGLMRDWEAKMNGKSMMKLPKVALFRNIGAGPELYQPI